MPRRRLSLVVAAGALALVALAGCRVEPGSAAFVGNTTYSKSGLDRIVDQYKKDGGKVDATDEHAIREEIARDQVFVDVASRYADEQHYDSPSVDTGSLAQQSGLPENDPFLQLYAKTQAYKTLLFQKISAVEPTDAEVREVYEYLVRTGAVTESYAEAGPQIRQLDGFGQAIAVRRALTDAAHRYQVRMNPLYDGDFPLLSVSNQGNQIRVVVLPLSGTTGTSAVRDVTP
jgi:hypothetical protein